MDTKIWFLLTVVTIVRSKDLSEGSDSLGTNTQKIFDENKKANPAIWRQVDNITITGDEGMKINKILVKDLREEKDGEAKIVEGGIGQQNVTIELKSPTALRGYDFHIEVYANSNNGQASTSHDASQQEAKPGKSSEEKNPINAVPNLPISLTRDEPSSTSEKPQDGLIIGGKRQNRDVENINKSNKQLNPHFNNATTEVTELKSTSIPATNKDKREDKDHEHGIAIQPIHLQEAPKMPESTARSIPTTEFKIAEEKHNHDEIHDNFDENKKQTNFDTNAKHTNTKYSQFNIREVTPNVPVNVQSPAEEGHKRHVRDVNQNIPVVETTQHLLPSSTLRNQGSTTAKAISDETNQPENSQAVPTENKQTKEHVHHDKVEEETIHEHHNHNNRFNGRYIPDRFARNRNSDSKRETSTEINKVSTTIASQSSTPIIPRINVNAATTNKPETSTGKEVNTDIKSELHINNNKRSTSEEITAHKRLTRDTTDKNNKEKPSVLPTSNLKDSPTSTTLKPEINGKTHSDINTSKVSSYSTKAPIEATEKESGNEHNNPKVDNLENKDKQRNIRGTEDNKNEAIALSTSTIKPENKETKKVQVPIQLKTPGQDVKQEPTDAKKENERITRDVTDIPKSHNDKLTPPTEITGVNVEMGMKSGEKVTKSLISTIKDDNKEQKETSTISPKIGESATQNPAQKNQPGKYPRGINKDFVGTSTTQDQYNTKNDLSTTSKPSVDLKKEISEPKQPEKSLMPSQ
ncbi:myb-like protein A [Papilio machaon]|uniref:myb-like protein A n=1 Tax=Papilio machaon TaxID=76193 RepID=UPI001E665316|nr:myb-like protein A [Papilio machaon]